MRPVSARFLRTIRGSHKMCVRARLCEPGQVGVNPDGIELPIISGDVQFDSTADVRATLSLTTNYPWPVTSSDLFNPYGAEIFIERGVDYGQTREWVALGYFRIYEISQSQAPNGNVVIAGKDRMSALIDARVLSPVEFIPGTPVQDMYQVLVLGVLPGVTLSYDFNPALITWSGNHILEEDRHKFLLDVTRSLGKIMFFDYDGSFRVEAPPDPTTSVWDVTHGAGGVLVSASRTLNREGAYNAVVAYGDQTAAGDAAAPARAVAVDDDPHSPTYWFGGYGQVPRYYSSSFIQNDTQAASAAQAMLVRAKGLPFNVDLTAVPNPAIEPLDPVTVSYSDRSATETHVLDQLTIPLDPGSPMTGSTRKLSEEQ